MARHEAQELGGRRVAGPHVPCA